LSIRSRVGNSCDYNHIDMALAALERAGEIKQGEGTIVLVQPATA